MDEIRVPGMWMARDAGGYLLATETSGGLFYSTIVLVSSEGTRWGAVLKMPLS